MRKTSSILLTVAAILAVAIPAAAAEKTFDESLSDPKAVQLSRQLMDAMGGRKAWDDLHFLRFDFASVRDGQTNVIRSHWWDKYTGRHRVEGKTREGEPFVILHNINTHEGDAWKSGVKLEGEEERKFLENAWGYWVNDTYWLLMPYKMNDPGVILSYDGEEELDGRMYDKVALSFDNVGLTPNDRYWAWINRDTHLMDQWGFILKGGEGPAAKFRWNGWKKFGNVMLSPERAAVDSANKIVFLNLATPASMPDGGFVSPSPVE